MLLVSYHQGGLSLTAGQAAGSGTGGGGGQGSTPGPHHAAAAAADAEVELLLVVVLRGINGREEEDDDDDDDERGTSCVPETAATYGVVQSPSAPSIGERFSRAGSNSVELACLCWVVTAPDSVRAFVCRSCCGLVFYL